MSLDLKSIELFQRVARGGVISKAGEELGYSATTATQRIQALEADLGVKLFNRTTRRVALTQDGQDFLIHAWLILNTVEDARQSLSGGATRIKGLLRVTGSATFGRKYIAPHIAEFMQVHPEAQVHLNLSDTVTDLIEHGYDLAIRVGRLESSSLIARKLSDNPRALVAAPAYVAKYGQPNLVADLAKHQCILSGGSMTWVLKTSSGKLEKVKVSGAFSSNYGEAILESTLGGLGISLKSLWDVTEHLKSGSLVQILPNHEISPKWDIWAVRPPTPLMPARTRVFIEFLEGKFKKLPPAT